MAGSFQFLHSRDLVWTRRMREYLMGEREQPSDLMAWNTDTTRMPARMHNEYLTSLYLHNALATGRTASAAAMAASSRWPTSAVPMFVVGTVARPRLALALGLQAAPADRRRDHLRAGQRRPQRRHRLRARPRQAQLPDRHAAGTRHLGRRPTSTSATRRATRARGGRRGRPGWRRTRRAGMRQRRCRARAALGDAPGEYVSTSFPGSA